MSELTVSGPDALRRLSHLTINSFANSTPNKAKQMVPCSHDGHVIGDGILFYLDKDELLFVGRTPTVNWIQFHAETGGYKVEVIRDDRSPSHPRGKAVSRRHYRYQIQGPNAARALERLNGGPLPDVKFFQMDAINIRGRRVRCLRHGMAGGPGLEVWGRYAEADEIREAILEAGRDFGLVQVGARAYGPYIQFDHDFIGREALEQIAKAPHRKKVTLAWNSEDVLKIFASLLVPGGENYKYFDFPNCNYASSSFDKIVTGSKTVGFSMFGGYSYNERTALSLGVVDPDIEIGDVLTLIWGEENGGTRKTTVEPHRQLEVRVRVSPTPYARAAREAYHEGWRTRQVHS